MAVREKYVASIFLRLRELLHHFDKKERYHCCHQRRRYSLAVGPLSSVSSALMALAETEVSLSDMLCAFVSGSNS